MSLTGGPFTFNRFDEYERRLNEKLDPVGKEDSDVDNDGDVDSSDGYLKKRREAIGKAMGKTEKGASSPGKMAKEVRSAAKKNKAKGAAMEKEDKKEEAKQEKVTAESFWIEDEEGNIYEGKKDACYHKVKSRYDVWPSAYASGALVKCRKAGASNWGNKSKKEDVFMDDLLGHEYVLSENRFAAHGGKDTDPGAKYAKPNKTKPSGKTYTMKGKDGKPLFGEATVTPGADLAQRKLNKDANNSKLKVTKAVMEQDQRMAMYSRALGIMGSHYSGQPLAEKESTDERKSAADKSAERDRQEKEGKYKDAAESEAKMKKQDKELAKEDVQLTKQDVVDYLVSEGYASNEVSAEILHTHISDEFLEEIEDRMISEMGPAFPSETKAQAKAQGDHRSGKSSAGLKTGKNPGLKASHTSGANRQD